MQEVRRKVTAKMMLMHLADRYYEFYLENTASALAQLCPTSQPYLEDNYTRLSTFVKSLQVLLNIRQRRAFQQIAELAESRIYFDRYYGQDD